MLSYKLPETSATYILISVNLPRMGYQTVQQLIGLVACYCEIISEANKQMSLLLSLERDEKGLQLIGTNDVTSVSPSGLCQSGMIYGLFKLHYLIIELYFHKMLLYGPNHGPHTFATRGQPCLSASEYSTGIMLQTSRFLLIFSIMVLPI